MHVRLPTLLVTPLIWGCVGVRNVEPDWLNATDEEQEGPAQHGGTSDAGDVEVQEGCDEEDTNTKDGFRIAGNVYDLFLQDTPEDPESLCAYALNPTPVLSLDDPIFMAGSQVCNNGDFVISELSNPPTIGMFVSIDDCEGNEDRVMSSATGIDYDDVKDLRNGDILENVRAYLMSKEYGEQIGGDLVGFDGDAVEIGFMSGFVLDVEDAPVSGAALSCGNCADFYYMDTDPSDGLFTTGDAVNTSTDSAAEAIFVAPGAPIATYAAEDGGNHEWQDQLFGSLPGYASFLLFNAQ